MVRGVEDLRTPLSTILDLECQLRGTIAGFLMPQFVVDLPGGGGKRLANSYTSYDRTTGLSTFVAPAVSSGAGKGNQKQKVFEYHDPLWALEDATTVCDQNIVTNFTASGQRIVGEDEGHGLARSGKSDVIRGVAEAGLRLRFDVAPSMASHTLW